MATISDDKCRAKAHPDEPIFTLLARDRHAPALVWLWAVLREIDGEEQAVVDEARDCVVKMIEYATSKSRKVVGVGVAVMAGVTELIRAANSAAKVKSGGTPAEVVRRFLCAAEVAG